MKLWENSKNSYFPKRNLPVSLMFGLCFIFLQEYQKHCVKSVQIRSFICSTFSHIQTPTDTWYFSVFSPNAEKYGPEKTPSLDTFHAVKVWISVWWKLSRIEIAYFLSSFLWDLKIQILIIQIITCSAAKTYVVVIFSSWFQRIFFHISILISQFTKAAL